MSLQAQWIGDGEALAALLDGAPPLLGFDTEFIRVRTFYPQPALYQLAIGEHIALVDPLTIDTASFAPLVALLASPSHEWVMHACSEDLELLRHHLGVVPACVFDTQIAAALCYPDAGLGYAALVQRVLDVALDKSETRSDWRQRPLSNAQLHYATADVEHLAALHRHLTQRLIGLGRLGWLREEAMLLTNAARRDRDPAAYFSTLRDANRLSPRALAVLRALCAWREETARRRDRPRAYIVPDPVLLDMARRGVRTQADIGALLQPPVSDRWAGELAEIIDTVQASGAEVDPASLPSTDEPALRGIVKSLRPRIASLAARLDIAEGVVASRRLLDVLLRRWQVDSDALPDEWTGWRREIVLPELLPALATWRADRE